MAFVEDSLHWTCIHFRELANNRRKEDILLIVYFFYQNPKCDSFLWNIFFEGIILLHTKRTIKSNMLMVTILPVLISYFLFS